MKVLIAGGAGFIGSHLCEACLEKGLKVICVDNLITGSEKNIELLKKNPDFEFVRKDICEENLDYECDFIFHLASPASPVDYQNHPEETALANSVGTKNILDLTRKNNCKTLIVSTSEVYGDPKEHPQKEIYWGHVNSFGPRSCYDESKRFSEALSYIYLHKYSSDVRIARIFNTYGPKMQKDDGRVVSNFINQALRGESLTIYGDGNQTRSFCFVSDMVEGLVKLMFNDNTKGEVVNLGNPEEYKMIDLAEKIKKIINPDLDFKYLPLPKDDPGRRCPDISKAKNLLGWEPKVSFDEGVIETIKYYKENL